MTLAPTKTLVSGANELAYHQRMVCGPVRLGGLVNCSGSKLHLT
jgi:hypothetical protein